MRKRMKKDLKHHLKTEDRAFREIVDLKPSLR